ncbi:MAG: hypothetical protein HY915_02465 [Desulfovibrio sp.]|nr:hypothetical protein [Desulfovibrio sp.]
MSRVISTTMLLSLILSTSVCWGMGASPTLPDGSDITGASTTNTQTLQQQQQALADLQKLYQMTSSIQQGMINTEQSAFGNLR